jgi:hypothetical protein
MLSMRKHSGAALIARPWCQYATGMSRRESQGRKIQSAAPSGPLHQTKSED